MTTSMTNGHSIEISLALPAYNEEKNIVSVLDRSVASLDQIGRAWEILVIDNHSNDDTSALVEDYMTREPRVRLFRHEENRLYSGSCATALREARGRYTAIMDSDGQFVASDLPKFLHELEDGGANLVLGWRKKRNDPFMRLVMSQIFNWMGRRYLDYPLHDLNCGIRMFDREFIEATEIRHRINMANPEFYCCAKKAGLKLAEVEIEHFGRFEGVTSHNFARSIEIFKQVRNHLRELGRELRAHLADRPVTIPALEPRPSARTAAPAEVEIEHNKQA